MEPSTAPGAGSKRRNLGFFKPPRLYIQERRRTDTIISESAASSEEERCGTLKRSQSDRTEYSHKLKGYNSGDGPIGLFCAVGFSDCVTGAGEGPVAQLT
ncbi:hypothetical protein chiPu_0021832 [Chiloscyllium punctatum]|uniref:Uncharacterized protein n=1 Tax=Chiloscyllium punctatum TaxID=137246 RepID=A0A401RMZ8_CHIPU|nr:hypothetical protein [Chiloscyllium punctatum]